jgi:hypothetical protein
MRWQYTFSHNCSRYLASAIFRADDFCLQKLIWNSDGTFSMADDAHAPETRDQDLKLVPRGTRA